jgi:hypothetical protein
MAVSKKLKRIYFGLFEKPELFCANAISNFQQKRLLNKNIDKSFKLTKEQKKQIKDFWKPYCRVSTKWAQYYTAKNGRFDPRYIPNDLYFTKIDQHFNNRKLGYGFNDKNYYSLIFPEVMQPKVLVRKIGTFLYSEDYKIISVDAAVEVIKSESEVIIKPTQETGSGRGISFVKTNESENELRELLLNDNEENIIIQAIVRQHDSLATIYPTALNTIRVTTLTMDDGVHILSAILRMGSGNSRVDNASSGGISVGINDDGYLNDKGHILYSGRQTDKHPDGFVFKGFKVPEFDKVKSCVKRLAQYTGNFRLVSWDMTVDKNGNVVLIEANMRKGGIAIHQFNNGPLFGDLTEKVLGEIFN